jgi:hypothetical protein
VVVKQALIGFCMAAAASLPAMAADKVHVIPLADVLAMPEAAGKLDGSIKFFLKGQNTPAVEASLGEGISNRGTGRPGKDDVFACKWAILSALMALQEQAKTRGANAVVDMVSYYKRNTVENATGIECHQGSWVNSMAVKGTYAKLAGH